MNKYKRPTLRLVREKTTYWLSFADEEGFHGVAILDSDDNNAGIVEMVERTIELGCNPGRGSVRMERLLPGSCDPIPDSYKNRLLTRDEVERLNAGQH